MLLESANATTKHVEELLDMFNDNADSSIRIEDHLTGIGWWIPDDSLKYLF